MDKRVVLVLFCVAAVVPLPAQTFTTLMNLNPPGGTLPRYVVLAQGADGNLYGTTSNGGIKGLGTVFGMTPGGALTISCDFVGANGNITYAGVILATDGNFYGTTLGGGADNGAQHRGTIFKVTSGGTLTTLYTFDGTDGSSPRAPLLQAADGYFYGTTADGGTYDLGTVFKFTAGGALTTLHAFHNADGATPYGGLIQGHDGNFYGTTAGGGVNKCGSEEGYCGTIFRIGEAGEFEKLHDFDGADGNEVFAGLAQGTDGSFYGATTLGGAYGGGTVFKMTPNGSFTTLYSFPSGGGGPFGTLVQATDGNFYGTTDYGETIFSITPEGALTTLYTLGPDDGYYPLGGLLQATDGNFYGTTNEGPLTGYGTVYKLATGLGPFVKTVSMSGRVGDAVIILGTSLTGTSHVSFNGTAAAFTIASANEIVATVPAGARTGPIEVVTPGGKLLSNAAFRVRP